jgi:isoaspartyl peptidase/L-asparaginase-like protein (Ntn-hydrolase superfamily)
MRSGTSPQQATEDSIRRIAKFYPNFQGGIIAVNKTGHFGGACHGFQMEYSVRSIDNDKAVVFTAPVV